jgi:hypothetical protein
MEVGVVAEKEQVRRKGWVGCKVVRSLVDGRETKKGQIGKGG